MAFGYTTACADATQKNTVRGLGLWLGLAGVTPPPLRPSSNAGRWVMFTLHRPAGCWCYPSG
jgi:hypothetical protein